MINKISREENHPRALDRNMHFGYSRFVTFRRNVDGVRSIGMKKSGVAIISLLMLLSLLGGCAKEKEEKVSSAPLSEKQNITIGISKIVSHPALDAIEKGIQDELTQLGYDNITYDLQNANGEPSTAKQIAVKFKADKVDLAVGIATPTSQALVSTLTGVPIVFSGVTDPVGAGLVPSLDRGGEYTTGYSDMTPVREQIEFLASIMDLKRLGHVYTSGEANAVVLADMAREVCNDLGIEFVESTVTNSAEVKQATQAILGRVDAIYVSTDNTVFSALNSLAETALEKQIPVMSADPTSAETFPVLAAIGFDYYRHGRATGRLIAKILEGADPAEIPTQFMTDPEDLDQLVLNKDVADAVGITFSQDVLDRASVIVENGEIEHK
jgi:putative ABC transport system substrate-binding protein